MYAANPNPEINGIDRRLWAPAGQPTMTGLSLGSRTRVDATSGSTGCQDWPPNPCLHVWGDFDCPVKEDGAATSRISKSGLVRPCTRKYHRNLRYLDPQWPSYHPAPSWH